MGNTCKIVSIPVAYYLNVILETRGNNLKICEIHCFSKIRLKIDEYVVFIIWYFDIRENVKNVLTKYLMFDYHLSPLFKKQKLTIFRKNELELYVRREEHGRILVFRCMSFKVLSSSIFDAISNKVTKEQKLHSTINDW